MDYRDTATHYQPVLQDVDTRHMRATFTSEDASGEETIYTVRLQFDVCDTCDGRGSYVNPSIDSHGLSAEDFADDPDFAEDYHDGRYDVPCSVCHGARVVPVVDEDANAPDVVALYHQREQEAWDSARETADWRERGY